VSLFVPFGELVDARLALEPAPVRFDDVVVSRGEDVEHEPTAFREAFANGRECGAAVIVGLHVQQRAERDRHERKELVDRWLSQVAEAKVELDARSRRRLARYLEHPFRGVDADHTQPRERGWHRDPPRPDPELEHRPARAHRLGDIEVHVFDDAHRPGVVEPRDLVVDRHAGMLPPTMDWQEYEAQATSAIGDAATIAALEDVRVEYLGRKSALALALREVRDRETGILLNGIRQRLEGAAEGRERALSDEELDRRLRDEVIDVTLPGEELAVGHLHPITQVRRMVEDAFLGLGYEVRDDREVETVEYNFDKLAFLPTHSARSPRDTFFFDESRVLRTETSPSQIHIMEEKAPPIYMVSLGRVYRRDAITATRYPIFHQFEGLAVDKGLTLADLKGTLLHVMRQLYGPDRRVRFRTHYFPFTEPSIEPDVSCGICGGAGCRTCKFSGWIEMGGAGMVDPQVFANVGLDPEEWSGFAFGCGLERTAQLRHFIPDIRALWEGDLRVLRQF
jgi:phenylalanyl-tRNA synthetase alpha chain